MEPEYILLISAGGVFALLLFIYLIFAIEKAKAAHRSKMNISKAYLPENLQKMEYDVAFYDKNVFSYGYRQEAARQVTIDDILVEEADDTAQMTEEAVFTQVEDKGMEQITGNFKNN